MAAPDFKLEQFKTLREEVGRRSNYQHTLIGLTITAVGTIAGFVLAQEADSILLLLVPCICFGLGMLWYDHAINIDRIGLTLATIERDLGSFSSGGETGVMYEAGVRKFERSRIPPRVFPLGMVLLVLFAAIPAIALLLALPSVLSRTGWIRIFFLGLCVIEAAATLLQIVVMSHWAWPPRRDV